MSKSAERSAISTAVAYYRFDGLQNRQRLFHRPFETALSVDRCEADQHPDGQPSSPQRPPSPPHSLGHCQTDDDRPGPDAVTSWGDCLRQLAITLRQRQAADDSGSRAEPADLRSPNQTTRYRDRHNVDAVRRTSPKSFNDHVNEADVSSSSSLYANKLEKTTKTECGQSVDDVRSSFVINAPVVRIQSRQGVNWSLFMHIPYLTCTPLRYCLFSIYDSLCVGHTKNWFSFLIYISSDFYASWHFGCLVYH